MLPRNRIMWHIAISFGRALFPVLLNLKCSHSESGGDRFETHHRADLDLQNGADLQAEAQKHFAPRQYVLFAMWPHCDIINVIRHCYGSEAAPASFHLRKMALPVSTCLPKCLSTWKPILSFSGFCFSSPVDHCGISELPFPVMTRHTVVLLLYCLFP